jgi:uncharacterized protein YoaH (UPF0181 family)
MKKMMTMSNNKQQTAVEWLEQEMLKPSLSMKAIIEQAKEMEKEQKANTWNNAINAVEKDKWESFEQYYDETYGGGEQ